MSQLDLTNVFYQWDRGRRIQVCGDNILQVHFAAKGDKSPVAAAVEPYREDGSIYADIPDRMLQTAGQIDVFLYCDDAEIGTYSVPWIFITVLPREKPSDYVCGEDEVLSWQMYEARMRAVEGREPVSWDSVTCALGFTPASRTELDALSQKLGAAVLYLEQETEPSEQLTARANLGLSQEVWTFTLEDGTTVEKGVVLV